MNAEQQRIVESIAADLSEVDELRARVKALADAGNALATELNAVHRHYHGPSCSACAAWMAWLDVVDPIPTPNP